MQKTCIEHAPESLWHHLLHLLFAWVDLWSVRQLAILLTALSLTGATVQRMRPVSITNPDHFVNVARCRAAQEPNSIFADQFENLANFRAHLQTGQELWQQCNQHLNGFVCGAGTGGTIAGISTFLKQQCSSVQVFLIDPPGSGLYNKVP